MYLLGLILFVVGACHGRAIEYWTGDGPVDFLLDCRDGIAQGTNYMTGSYMALMGQTPGCLYRRYRPTVYVCCVCIGGEFNNRYMRHMCDLDFSRSGALEALRMYNEDNNILTDDRTVAPNATVID